MPNKSVKSVSAADHPAPDHSKLSNGPVESRSCTDCLCLLIFAAFIAGMVAITIYGLNKGNPELVGRGYDSDGKICGHDEGYEDFPLLYWPVPIGGNVLNTVCIASCPKDPLPTTLACKTNSKFSTCTGVNDETAIDALIQSGLTSGQFFIYDTTSIAGRICMPAAGLAFATQISDDILDSDLLGQWISDIRTTWPIILACIGIAAVIGVIYMFFLRFCAGVLTWVAILAFMAASVVLGWRYWQKSVDTQKEIDATQSDNVDNLKDTKLTERIIAICCFVIAGITFLTVCCLFKRIQLAIGIIKAAADYVKSTLTVLLVPPVFLIALLAFYVYWTITTVFLVSSGTPEQMSKLPVGTFEFNGDLQKLLIYHLFALLWCNAFINAACQFVIASSVCIWYFAQGTGQWNTGSIRKSLYRLFRYHLGSIAFGSLLLAIVQMIRWILVYFQKKAEDWAGKEGRLMRFVLCCLQCYVGCFERFIKFLNKNAYIQIALTGKSFCFAAKDGFMLVARNPLRFSVLNGIGSIFIWFGKCFIAAISTLVGFLIITKASKYEDHIYSPFIPTALMFIFSFTVGSLFLNIYGMAADTILACFVLDEEIQKKRNAPPLHCPASLRSFMNKHKK